MFSSTNYRDDLIIKIKAESRKILMFWSCLTYFYFPYLSYVKILRPLIHVNLMYYFAAIWMTDSSDTSTNSLEKILQWTFGCNCFSSFREEHFWHQEMAIVRWFSLCFTAFCICDCIYVRPFILKLSFVHLQTSYPVL